MQKTKDDQSMYNNKWSEYYYNEYYYLKMKDHDVIVPSCNDNSAEQSTYNNINKKEKRLS